MKVTELKVEGMTCGHCVNSVQRLLNDFEGVISTVVSLPNNAEISYDETKISIDKIKKIINDSEIYKTF